MPPAGRLIRGGNGFDPNQDHAPDGRSARDSGNRPYGDQSGRGQARGARRNIKESAIQSKQSFRNSMSHLSSYKRRKEAQDALEKYVLREETQKSLPKVGASAHTPEYTDQKHGGPPNAVRGMHAIEPDIRQASAEPNGMVAED